LLWEHVRAVVAAFAIFGIYRIWLGIIECRPERFYASANQIPDKYRHVEPTFRLHWKEQPDGLVVDLDDTGCPHILSGTVFIFVAVLVLLIRSKFYNPPRVISARDDSIRTQRPSVCPTPSHPIRPDCLPPIFSPDRRSCELAGLIA